MSIRKLEEYRTLVFDCDGVILNSNQVKTNAFYKSVLPYGENAAKALVTYHKEHGGISRYKKFEYFLQNIVNKVEGPNLEELLEIYANEVLEGLLTCEVTPGLNNFREKTSNCRWMIASGGDQDELRRIFDERGLTSLFDGGIFGSPTSKTNILDREKASGNLSANALLIGDSKYDFESAQHAELDFLFVSAWSEIPDWPYWVDKFNINHIETIDKLCTGSH